MLIDGKPRRTLVGRATVVLAVALCAAGCGVAQGHSVQGRSAHGSDTLTVEPATTGPSIPSGFVGLSTEFPALAAYTGSNPKNVDPPFLQLIRNLSPHQQPVFRVGGDSTDWTWYPVAGEKRPGGIRYTLTPQWMRVTRAMATALNAKLILGVNLEADNRRIAAGEAQAMVNQLGRRSIDAMEIGNEPELYNSFAWYHTPSGARVAGRPNGWNEAAFAKQYPSFANALPQVPLAGPDSGAPKWLADLNSFLRAEPRVRMASIHAYPLKHCTASHVVTIADLLANSSTYGFARSMAPYVAVAHRAGKQLRIDEMNGITCGGTRGVSNAFASALWVLDTLFELSRTGVNGVNLNSEPGALNEILGPSFTRGRWAVNVRPLYYGMMMFAQAAPAGARLLRLSTAAPQGIKVWATAAPDGHVRVTLINDRSRRGQTMHLRIPAARGPAVAEQLRAPSLSATGGVTLGGQGFGSETATGQLAGKSNVTPVTGRGGAYTVNLPAASAILLTLSTH